VFYDLAFLLMDLVERGLGAAANAVLNRYLAETRRVEDLDALAALPLFLSLRAAIRAKVTAARRETATHESKDEIAKSARAYFALACKSIAPPPARLIAVGGLSGTGKSALAAALAPEIAPAPGAVVLRSDVERKTMFGIGETERLPAEAYRPEVTAKLYASLAAKARRVLAAGHSAIVDAVFSKPEEREAAAHAARPFTGLFLVADLDTRIARVGQRTHDASDADAEIARQQESYDLGSLDWRRVDANGSMDDTLANARTALNLSRG
jgi:predicted kinase